MDSHSEILSTREVKGDVSVDQFRSTIPQTENEFKKSWKEAWSDKLLPGL